MAFPVTSRSKQEPENSCAECGHGESEHGTTGSRPCLASIGKLTDRDFCGCDEFRPNAAKAA